MTNLGLPVDIDENDRLGLAQGSDTGRPECCSQLSDPECQIGMELSNLRAAEALNLEGFIQISDFGGIGTVQTSLDCSYVCKSVLATCDGCGS